jgi:Recombinase
MHQGPKKGFHTMRRDQALTLSRRGTRTLTERADDHALTYSGFIRAAVRSVGQNYRQVANWLTRERIPAQRNGRWAAQSVKNLVKRYERLTGKELLAPYKAFPTPARRKNAPAETPLVPWDDRGPGRRVRVPRRGIYWCKP